VGAKSQRRSTAPEPIQDGPGSFVDQVSLFETGNGLAHGPAMILIALGLAVAIYPIRRLVRAVLSR
jgi:hypothetical protein